MEKGEYELALFNLAMPYLTRINNLLSKISTCYMQGEAIKMMWALRALYREIAPKLKKEEREKIDEQFQKAFMLKKNKKLNSFFRQLEDIDISLRDHLEARGILLPSSQDRRFLKGLKKEME